MKGDQIQIDESSRITIDVDNYKLEYRIKNSKKDGSKPVREFRWELGGYFQSLGSLAEDWLENAPARSETSVKTIKELSTLIRASTNKIIKSLNQNE